MVVTITDISRSAINDNYTIELELSADDGFTYLLPQLFIPADILQDDAEVERRIKFHTQKTMPYLRYVGRSYKISNKKLELDGYNYTEADKVVNTM